MIVLAKSIWIGLNEETKNKLSKNMNKETPVENEWSMNEDQIEQAKALNRVNDCINWTVLSFLILNKTIKAEEIYEKFKGDIHPEDLQLLASGLEMAIDPIFEGYGNGGTFELVTDSKLPRI